MCQCPERGDLHFYPVTRIVMEMGQFECQCPERGDLHFYSQKEETNENTGSCVNALKGATFISTRWRLTEKISEITLCQCPERGDLHFYNQNHII